MIVLERELSRFHDKLNLVTTPSGLLVAMVHSNNGTGEYDSWISLFKEVIEITGNKVTTADLYDKLLSTSLKGNHDCGGLIAYNYLSGETITGFSDGRPLFTRTLDSKFNLSNFMRAQLFTSLCSLRIGLDILF
jgi:sugar (pentulose or hexulose) kinase